MAIYGIGSNWNGYEVKEDSFEKEQIVIGQDKKNANDLYSFISSLKVGDIVYLKSNKPGSRDIRIKAIGIVTKDLVGCITSGECESTNITDWESLFIKVKWILKEEFLISIPVDKGKLTNIRAATVYEEYLPYVQNEIISHLFN